MGLIKYKMSLYHGLLVMDIDSVDRDKLHDFKKSRIGVDSTFLDSNDKCMNFFFNKDLTEFSKSKIERAHCISIDRPNTNTMKHFVPLTNFLFNCMEQKTIGIYYNNPKKLMDAINKIFEYISKNI